MKSFILTVTALTLCTLGFAKGPGAPNIKLLKVQAAKPPEKKLVPDVERSPLSTTDCSFTFTSGADNTSLKYCVTANGNIVQFETPVGVPMVSQSDFGEGYGICDAASHMSYFDFGGRGDSGNWSPAQLLSQTAKSVKIARTTSDGLWTLTQTINQVTGGSPSATIAMSLKNNSGVTKEAFLLRYADIDAGGASANNFDGTLNSALAWNSFSSGSSGGSFGLVLQNLGTVPFGYDGFAQNTPNAPDPCVPFTHFSPTLFTNQDGSLVMFYDIPTIHRASTATVNVGYKGW